MNDTVPWHKSIDLSLPYWEDFEVALSKLSARQGSATEFPDVDALQSLVSTKITNQHGKPIRFVSPSSIPDGNYEEQIFNTGRVSTRAGSWHDLFNALVWWRFPGLKAAMNALHFAELQKQSGNERGRLRDALTLLDECGIIVASHNDQILRYLVNRNWKGAFCDLANLWQNDVRVFVCGHALLEKFLNPYKANTANALFVKTDPDTYSAGRTSLLEHLEKTLAQRLLQGELIRSSADLSPLPLAGIPGWWQGCSQDEDFYADEWVFRKPAASFVPPAIVDL